MAAAAAARCPGLDRMLMTGPGAVPAGWESYDVAGRSLALSCRNEGVVPGRIYAQKCMIFHDSASVFTSQRQLLRKFSCRRTEPDRRLFLLVRGALQYGTCAQTLQFCTVSSPD